MKTNKFNVLFIAIAIFMTSNFVISCGDDDEEDSIQITSSKDLSMKYGETSQIQCTQKSVTFESEDEFVATVSASGEIKANHVGSTYIKVNGNKMIKVAVVPKYTNFDEPIVDFGISMSKVKSLEKSTPIKEGDDGLSYNGTGDEYGRIYLFKNGKLSSSAMVVRYTYSSILADFLLERYMVIDVDKSKQTSTFVNGLTEETITMGIGTSIDGNMFIVLYIPMTDIATRSIFQIGNEETIARIKKFLEEK